MTPVRSVHVRDFQSVQDGQVEFGDFTVLVGPSNSGKSAFLRAVRACLRNTFVPANVRVGSTKSVITAELEDVDPITIERGKSLSTYRLGEEAYTKSGKSIPEPVAKAISMPLVEGADLNFSFQFDRPFLLDETGSQAAQVVGSLTNVTLLHEAVREANRRRQEAAQRLKVRQSDVERYVEQAKDFADLPEQHAKIKKMEADLASIEEDSEQLRQLTALTNRLDESDQALAELTIPDKPDSINDQIEELEELITWTESLQSLVSSVTSQAEQVRATVALAQSLHDQAQRHQEEYQNVLHELGVCPTCGGKTA